MRKAWKEERRRRRRKIFSGWGRFFLFVLSVRGPVWRPGVVVIVLCGTVYGTKGSRCGKCGTVIQSLIGVFERGEGDGARAGSGFLSVRVVTRREREGGRERERERERESV